MMWAGKSWRAVRAHLKHRWRLPLLVVAPCYLLSYLVSGLAFGVWVEPHRALIDLAFLILIARLVLTFSRKVWAFAALMALLIAAFFIGFGIVFLLAFLTVLMWDEHRLLALGLATAGLFAAGVAGAPAVDPHFFGSDDVAIVRRPQTHPDAFARGAAQYAKNLLTITRQIRPSSAANETVDILLSLNGLPIATAELKINLLRPARGERLVCRGRVLKPGKQLSFVEAEVYCVAAGKEHLVAKVSATMAMVSQKNLV